MQPFPSDAVRNPQDRLLFGNATLTRRIPACGGVLEYEGADGRRLVVVPGDDGRFYYTWMVPTAAARLRAAQHFGVAHGPRWADDVLWSFQTRNQQIPRAFPGRPQDALAWARQEWPTEDVQAWSIAGRERYRRADERWSELTARI